MRTIIGIDPGTQMSGTVQMVLEPTLGVVLLSRMRNDQLLDLVWSSDLIFVAMEDFRLYPWAAHQKIWDSFNEVRLIGRVEEVTRRRAIPLFEISPAQSKAVSDRALSTTGLLPSNLHVRDAWRVLWCALLGVRAEEEPRSPYKMVPHSLRHKRKRRTIR